MRHFSPKSTIVFLLTVWSCFYGLNTWAAYSEIFSDDQSQPWHIAADYIRYNNTTQKYQAQGNVVVEKQGKKITADAIDFDAKTMEVVATGHVVFVVGDDMLYGEKIQINLNQEMGVIYQSTVFIQENHFYIKGESIEKIGPDTYKAKKASITTCDSDKPAWKITARQVNVTIDGYGVAKHATFRVADIPVLYSPLLIFPVKLHRQTGFLVPQIGYSSRKWEEYLQPFYWAIDDHSDATFYLDHMGRRGEKMGLEYRYIWSQYQKGALMADFLNDKKVDNGLEGDSDWAYEDDDVLRPNKDRYWFRMKHDFNKNDRFTVKTDIDWVSDQDYLHEFNDGYTGFTESDEYFSKNFGRQLDPYEDSTRLNRLWATQNWDHYAINAQIRWYDNVIYRRQSITDPPAQKLPQIDVTGQTAPLLNSPVFYDWNADYVYYYKKDSLTTHRADIHPRFYTPFTVYNIMNFVPSVGIRSTVWSVEDQSVGSGLEPSDEKETRHRELYDVGLDLSTELSKIYALDNSRFCYFKHKIIPKISYSYIPDKDQSDLPNLDDVDRIDKKNTVTYSVINTLFGKSKPKKLQNSKKDIEIKEECDSYRQICRLEIGQSYDFNLAADDSIEDKRPFSPVYLNLDITPVDNMALYADTSYNVHDMQFVSGNLGIFFKDKRDDQIFIEHRYTKDILETVTLDLYLNLTDSVACYTNYDRNIKDDKTLEWGTGLIYHSQCWSVDFKYTDQEGDHRFSAVIDLLGLGGIESGVSGRNIKRTF